MSWNLSIFVKIFLWRKQCFWNHFAQSLHRNLWMIPSQDRYVGAFFYLFLKFWALCSFLMVHHGHSSILIPQWFFHDNRLFIAEIFPILWGCVINSIVIISYFVIKFYEICHKKHEIIFKFPARALKYDVFLGWNGTPRVKKGFSRRSRTYPDEAWLPWVQ